MMQFHFNTLVLGILFSLAIYHIMIYSGRKEKSYLNFSYFIFTCSVFIFFNSNHMDYLKIKHPDELESVGRMITSLLILITSSMFIRSSFAIKKSIAYPAIYLVEILNIFFVVIFILIQGYSVYQDFAKKYVTFIQIIIFLAFITVVSIQLINEKAVQTSKQKIISFGFILMALYLILQGASVGIKHLSFINGNYSFLCFIIMLFSYALAKGFNEEYNKLPELSEHLEIKVKERTQELENEKEWKTNFFMNIAHEIKTPLTLIKAQIDSLNEEFHERISFKIMKKNLDKIIRDIVNFMDLEKYKKGLLHYNHDETINLSEIVIEKTALFNEISKRKNIPIISEIEPNIFINADIIAIDRILNDLSNNNKVVIISGRNKDFLSKYFTGVNVTLIAEHGAFLMENQGQWQQLANINIDWKKNIIPILESYVDKTPNAFIEDKDFSLVWHYRKADPELVKMRLHELKTVLREATSNLTLGVIEGNKIIEIRNFEINKGNAVKKLLIPDYDFALAIGDDNTDEDMFEIINPLGTSIKVGLTLSKASYYFEDYKDVRNFLLKLI